MSKLFGMVLHGEVFRVEDRTIGDDMRIAIIEVKSVSADEKGRPVDCYFDVRVSAEQVKQGLHNSYRSMIGAEVFIPVSASIYQGRKAYQQYNLGGFPVRLQALPPKPEQVPSSKVG